MRYYKYNYKKIGTHKTKLDPDLVDISQYNKFQLELFFVLERQAHQTTKAFSL